MDEFKWTNTDEVELHSFIQETLSSLNYKTVFEEDTLSFTLKKDAKKDSDWSISKNIKRQNNPPDRAEVDMKTLKELQNLFYFKVDQATERNGYPMQLIVKQLVKKELKKQIEPSRWRISDSEVQQELSRLCYYPRMPGTKRYQEETIFKEEIKKELMKQIDLLKPKNEEPQCNLERNISTSDRRDQAVKDKKYQEQSNQEQNKYQTEQTSNDDVNMRSHILRDFFTKSYDFVRDKLFAFYAFVRSFFFRSNGVETEL